MTNEGEQSLNPIPPRRFFINGPEKIFCLASEEFKKNLSVIQVRNSDVVNILITSGNPELAKFLLEQLIDSYLKYDVDTKVKVTNYANAQINLRLSKLLDQMEIAEQKLLENNIDINRIIGGYKSVRKEVLEYYDNSKTYKKNT